MVYSDLPGIELADAGELCSIAAAVYGNAARLWSHSQVSFQRGALVGPHEVAVLRNRAPQLMSIAVYIAGFKFIKL